TGCGIIYIGSLFELSRINPEEGQFTDVGIRHNFKCKSREWFLNTGLPLKLLIVIFRIFTLDRRYIIRTRHIFKHFVQQCLNALILKSRTAHYRRNITLQRSLADSIFNFFSADLLIHKILFHQHIIMISNGLKHHLAILLGLSFQLIRNFDLLILHTKRFVVPNNTFHLNKINDTEEVFLYTTVNLNRNGISIHLIAHLVKYIKEIGVGTFHLINKVNEWIIIL